MGAILKGIAAAVIIVVVIAGGIMLAGWGSDPEPVTMTIKFTATDLLAGDTDAATTMVDIYRLKDGNLVKQETVTMDAVQKESGKVYTTGETLYLYLYDSTDVSLCKQYLTYNVPPGDPAAVFDGSFQCGLDCVDRGNTAYDILVKDHNNTAYADAATMDVTNNSWDSNYAEIDLEVRNSNDDTGYVNSFNFLKNYANNHYLVLKATGTGWDSVNMISGGWDSYDKASARYFVISLDSNDIHRDKLAPGDYDPDGTLIKNIVFDFTGFESGDSVTFTYEYRYYSDWSYFQDTGNWGTDSATNPATSETVTIQY